MPLSKDQFIRVMEEEGVSTETALVCWDTQPNPLFAALEAIIGPVDWLDEKIVRLSARAMLQAHPEVRRKVH